MKSFIAGLRKDVDPDVAKNELKAQYGSRIDILDDSKQKPYSNAPDSGYLSGMMHDDLYNQLAGEWKSGHPNGVGKPLIDYIEFVEWNPTYEPASDGSDTVIERGIIGSDEMDIEMPAVKID